MNQRRIDELDEKEELNLLEETQMLTKLQKRQRRIKWTTFPKSRGLNDDSEEIGILMRIPDYERKRQYSVQQKFVRSAN